LGGIRLGRIARRGRERVFAVIASAAKQSISPRKGRMDCFASLAMTVQQLMSWLFENLIDTFTRNATSRRLHFAVGLKA